jgi:NADH-quinone oxidoreductase subunit E
MLTDEEKREIEEHLRNYAEKRAAVVEAMHILQRHRGWVPDECLSDLGVLVDMSPEEIDSVATSCNFIFREETGRHMVMVCNSVSCWITGHEQLRDGLIQRLGVQPGQTTPDGRFTLLPVECLGACDQAPCMLIDDDLYGPVEVDQIDGILEKYV